MTTSDHRHLSPATTMSEIPSSKAATRASMHALLLACDSFPVPLTHQQTFPGPSLPLMTITSPFTHAHCWACLAATGPPSILSICTCSLSNDRHAIHVRSQLKTPPHAAPCRAVACEVYTLTRDASPMSDWSSLGPPLVSIGNSNLGNVNGTVEGTKCSSQLLEIRNNRGQNCWLQTVPWALDAKAGCRVGR
ncbi:hypothetical protein JHK84_043541 [Glycine max]|nr:hypothetical protein JHK84_043541 [Glycine max]